MPNEHIKVDYNCLRHGAGIFVHSGAGVYRVEGAELFDFFHRVSTNSFRDVKLWQSVTTLFLNNKGRIIDRAAALNIPGNILVVGSRDEERRLIHWIKRYIITEDISVEDKSDDYTLIEIAGEYAASFVPLLPLQDDPENMIDRVFPLTETFPGSWFYTVKTSNGRTRFFILSRNEIAGLIIAHLVNAGEIYGTKIISEEAYRVYRLEEGIPEFPDEINDDVNPHEAGFMHDVSATKGCYIGQEVIARLETYGKVQRVLSGIIFENGVSQNSEFTLQTGDGEESGYFTNIVRSELLGANIGLAYVKKKYIGTDNEIFAFDEKGNKHNIKITGLPVRL